MLEFQLSEIPTKDVSKIDHWIAPSVRGLTKNFVLLDSRNFEVGLSQLSYFQLSPLFCLHEAVLFSLNTWDQSYKLFRVVNGVVVAQLVMWLHLTVDVCCSNPFAKFNILKPL